MPTGRNEFVVPLTLLAKISVASFSTRCGRISYLKSPNNNFTVSELGQIEGKGFMGKTEVKSPKHLILSENLKRMECGMCR